jgi:hypothetical protein
VLKLQIRSTAGEREPAGDVQQALRQRLGFGFGELTVEAERLGPEEQVVREGDDLQPHLVHRIVLEWELAQARHSSTAMFWSVWSVR